MKLVIGIISYNNFSLSHLLDRNKWGPSSLKRGWELGTSSFFILELLRLHTQRFSINQGMIMLDKDFTRESSVKSLLLWGEWKTKAEN